MKRVALYERVSTEEQKNHGLSLERQAEVLKNYANAQGYSVVGEYVDGGVSGHISYKKRPELMRMLSDIEQNKIDLVLFIKLDRFTRKVSDYYEIMKTFEQHGVSWAATEEDYETETSSGRFKVNILLSVAQDEAERTSERIKFVLEGKKEKGQIYSGKIPFGYVNVGGYPQIDPTKAEIVRKAFVKYIETRSVTKVRDFLRDTFGVEYVPDTIYRWVRNERYSGANGYPPIIDRATYRIVQGINSSAKPRAKRKGRTYLFQGLIHCAECGRLMTPRYVADDRPTYYVCTRGNSNLCSNNANVRESDIEKWLLSQIVDESKKVVKKAKDTDIDKEKAKLTSKMEKLKDLYLSDLIDKEIYVKEYESIKKDLDRLELVKAEQSLSVGEIMSELELYDQLTFENKARFWHRILQRIDIAGKGDFSFTLCGH